MKNERLGRLLRLAVLAAFLLAVTPGAMLAPAAKAQQGQGPVWVNKPIWTGTGTCKRFYTTGSGEWCDCMGEALDNATSQYEECETQPNPTPACQQLFDDFNLWWDNC